MNPAARHDKISMNPGFAGIENELYYADKTFMLSGTRRRSSVTAEAALRRGRNALKSAAKGLVRCSAFETER